MVREDFMVQIAGAVLLVLLTLTARDAQAADLVVWWEKGFYAQEDKAVADYHCRLRAGHREEGRAGFSTV
jgi:hypothetical protein